ncbi:MAG: DegV family protein [Desulfotomaculum sp.]|nr:DegV family protein [Desulfotomaculum sp.]
MSIKIVTDSTSYLPANLKAGFDISIVALSVNFDTETYVETEITNAFFYNKMAQSKHLPTSSQPTPHQFYTTFEKHIQANHSIVGIFISSEMSGTYSTALTAKKMIMDKYPDAVIELVDSRSNCMELGLAVLAAAKAAKEGQSMAEVLNQTHAVMQKSRFLFVPESLKYLKQGGRIGGAAALLGTILQIKPILTVVDGKTTVLNKARTKKKAVQYILDTFFEDITKKGVGQVVVHHIDNEVESQKLVQIIEEKINQPVSVCSIGPVIGLHVGPGTIALAYYTEF